MNRTPRSRGPIGRAIPCTIQAEPSTGPATTSRPAKPKAAPKKETARAAPKRKGTVRQKPQQGQAQAENRPQAS